MFTITLLSFKFCLGFSYVCRMFRITLLSFKFCLGFFDVCRNKKYHNFFKNCPVSKQLCIIIFQVEFIQILSGGYCRTVFFFIRPIAKKQCQSKQEINQCSDASQNAIFYNQIKTFTAYSPIPTNSKYVIFNWRQRSELWEGWP